MADTIAHLNTELAGTYHLVREVGAGGMATVYLAHDAKHNREVAIKFLKPELSALVALERFGREIHTVARMSHPHILPLYDSGGVGGRLFYVMPYIDGPTIRRRLEQDGPLPVKEAAEIAAAVAAALGYAHRRSVIHRDIKPENILLNDGEPLVTDFGIALAPHLDPDFRLTGAEATLGTPLYMSPEQVAGDEGLDGRSDIYALGAVLFEMLVGKALHEGPNHAAIVHRIAAVPAPDIRELRPEVPEALARALERALAKDPGERFSTAGEFADALEHAVAGEPESDTPEPARRAGNRVGIILAAVLVASFAGIVMVRRVVFSGGAERTERQFTFTGAARAPAFSPDGEMLAYLGAGGTAVLVQDVAGGNAITLVQTRFAMSAAPHWVSNGQRLLFRGVIDSIQGLYTVPRLGGEVQPMSTAPAGLVFPLGNTGSYVIGSQTGTISVGPIGGSRDSLGLPPDTRWLWNLAVSPDDRWIAYLAERGTGRAFIGTISTSGGANHVLLEGGEELLLSTEGLSGAALPMPQVLDWAPGSDAVYYRRAGGRGADIVRIGVNPRTGRRAGQPASVVTGLPGGISFDVSSDGRRLAYAGGAVRTHVHLFQLEDGTRRFHGVADFAAGTSQHFNPSFSRDGRYLGFRRVTPSGSDIFVRSVDDGLERRITQLERPQRLFGWAPDGDRLAITHETAAGMAISVVNLVTGELTPLGGQPTSGTSRPAWSPDGTRLLYPHGNAVHLVLHDFPEGTETVLLDDALGGLVAGPVWSPGGDQVVFRRYGVPDPGLWLYSFAEHAVRRVGEQDGMPLAWSANGNILYLRLGGFDDVSGFAIEGVRPDGTGTWLVGELPVRCHYLNVAMSSETETVACSVTETETDVWLIDDFARETR